MHLPDFHFWAGRHSPRQTRTPREEKKKGQIRDEKSAARRHWQAGRHQDPEKPKLPAFLRFLRLIPTEHDLSGYLLSSPKEVAKLLPF